MTKITTNNDRTNDQQRKQQQNNNDDDDDDDNNKEGQDRMSPSLFLASPHIYLQNEIVEGALMPRPAPALKAACDVHHLPAEGVLHQSPEGGGTPLETPLQQHPEKVAELLRSFGRTKWTQNQTHAPNQAEEGGVAGERTEEGAYFA